jgi:hypothetical protein
MTYGVGCVEQINTFRKMATLQHAGQFLDPISGELPNPNRQDIS